MELSRGVEDMKFSLYEQEKNLLVEGTTQFQYLGGMLEHMYNDRSSIYWHIGKTRALCIRLGKTLRR